MKVYSFSLFISFSGHYLEIKNRYRNSLGRVIQEKIRGHKCVVSSSDQSSELLRAAVKK